MTNPDVPNDQDRVAPASGLQAGDPEFATTSRAYGGIEGHAQAQAAGRTSLDYPQWVQVRTPAFKEWFGDWQAVRAQERLDAMELVEVRIPVDWRDLPLSEMRARMVVELDRMVRDQVQIEHPELGRIHVGRVGVKKTKSTSPDPAKVLVAADIEALIPASIYARSEPSRGGDGPNIDGYSTLLTKVSVDDVPLVAAFTVRHQSDGRWYYNAVTLHDVNRKERARDSNGRPDHHRSDGSRFAPLAGLHEFSRRSLARVNPDTVSKAVDSKTGEPLALYRGDAEALVEFDQEQERYRHRDGGRLLPQLFFTKSPSSPDAAAPVFLNARNPVGEIDHIQNGDIWLVFDPAQVQNAVGSHNPLIPNDPAIVRANLSKGKQPMSNPVQNESVVYGGMPRTGADKPFPELADLIRANLAEPRHHYELHDPFAETTFRFPTSEAAKAKAEEMGATRFQHRDADGAVKQVDKVDGEWYVRNELTPPQDSQKPPSAADKPLASVQEEIDQDALRSIEIRAEQRAAVGQGLDAETDREMAKADAHAFRRIEDKGLQESAAVEMANNAREYPEYKEGLDKAIPGYPGTAEKVYALDAAHDEKRKAAELVASPAPKAKKPRQKRSGGTEVKKAAAPKPKATQKPEKGERSARAKKPAVPTPDPAPASAAAPPSVATLDPHAQQRLDRVSSKRAAELAAAQRKLDADAANRARIHLLQDPSGRHIVAIDQRGVTKAYAVDENPGVAEKTASKLLESMRGLGTLVSQTNFLPDVIKTRFRLKSGEEKIAYNVDPEGVDPRHPQMRDAGLDENDRRNLVVTPDGHEEAISKHVLRSAELPDDVKKRFVHSDTVPGQFFDRNRKLAFIDKGARLATDQNSPDIIASMVSVAQAKGWQAITVKGHEDFRREAWLAASLAGIEVKGFKPSEQDLAKLDYERQLRMGNAMQPAAPTAAPATNEIAAARPEAQPPAVGTEAVALGEVARLKGVREDQIPNFMQAVQSFVDEAKRIGIDLPALKIFDPKAPAAPTVGSPDRAREPARGIDIPQPDKTPKR